MDELRGRGYGYWALGHVHSREIVANHPWIVYPGCLQGRHARDRGEGSDPSAIEAAACSDVEHRDLDVVRWVELAVDASEMDEDELLDAVRRAITVEVAETGDRMLPTRVVFSGVTPAHRALAGERDRILNELRSTLADASAGQAWLEKMIVKTSAPTDVTRLAARDDASWRSGADTAHAPQRRTRPERAVGAARRTASQAAARDLRRDRPHRAGRTQPGARGRGASAVAAAGRGERLMRLRTLELLAFGHFSGETLGFNDIPGTIDFVYGDNEAGKSTSLRAVTGFLYGIPPRTTDAFLHPMPTLRIGAEIVNADGTISPLIRRKGNRDTLRDRAEIAVADDCLARALAGLDQKLFERMYALSRETLAAGANDLLEGKGSASEALFGASLGLVGINDVLRNLEEEAAKIFKPGGSNPALNTTLRTLDEQRRDLRALELRRATYEARALVLEAAKHDRHDIGAEIQRTGRCAEAARAQPAIAAADRAAPAAARPADRVRSSSFPVREPRARGRPTAPGRSDHSDSRLGARDRRIGRGAGRSSTAERAARELGRDRRAAHRDRCPPESRN